MAFKDFIKDLPLDKISEIVAEVVVWWNETVKDVPIEELPFQVYAGGSLIACLLWFFVARLLPRPFGGMTWIIMIAALFTPSNSIDNTSDVAPAIVGVFYALLTKDFQQAAVKSLPIFLVIIGGFFLGFVWQLIRDTITMMQRNAPVIDKNIDKRPQKSGIWNKIKNKKNKNKQNATVTAEADGVVLSDSVTFTDETTDNMLKESLNVDDVPVVNTNGVAVKETCENNTKNQL